jgi:hypothetical protein
VGSVSSSTVATTWFPKLRSTWISAVAAHARISSTPTSTASPFWKQPNASATVFRHARDGTRLPGSRPGTLPRPKLAAIHARSNSCKQLHLVLSQELRAGHLTNLQEPAVLGAGLGNLNDTRRPENRSMITSYEVDRMTMSTSI